MPDTRVLSDQDKLIDDIHREISPIIDEHEVKYGLHGAPLMALVAVRKKIDRFRRPNEHHAD